MRKVMPKGTPYPKGTSGNPGGRPKSAEFRARCRRLAEKMLGQLERRMASDDRGLTMELVRAFAEVSNRGGYLNVADSARLLLDALATKELTAEQRTDLMRTLNDGEAEPQLEMESQQTTPR